MLSKAAARGGARAGAGSTLSTPSVDPILGARPTLLDGLAPAPGPDAS